jgi:ABC-type sulfate transport system permease component
MAEGAFTQLKSGNAANTDRSFSSPAICRSKSEIAPLLIIIRLEEFNYAQAAAIGTAMLMISFGLLSFVHLIQAWRRRRFLK